MSTSKFLGIEFAPLNVPLKRRLQTLACIYMTFNFVMGDIIGTLLSIYIFFFTDYYYIILLYAIWYIYDFDTCRKGGRRLDWWRRLPLFNYYRDYFPTELIKTADLDPNRNYIMGYHPHGIMCAGALCNFATEATNFSGKFPGIAPHLLTLTYNFYAFFNREFKLAYGICSVAEDSMRWILTQKGKGNAAIVVVGGAQEALDAHPGKYILTLKHRKGFARVALQTGADLVPVFSFGENDVYDQIKNPRGSVLRWVQEKWKNVWGFSPPLFLGRGIFNYNVGYLPFRSKIVTIVGSPIRVEKKENPTKEEINELHTQYINSLTQLFNEHKGNYGCGDKELRVY